MAKIKWEGGACPVPPETMVRCWVWDGKSNEEAVPWAARCWSWGWSTPGERTAGDITAYEIVEETDPLGRDPKAGGAKLDAGKSPVRRGLLEYFPRACLAVAEISQFGASKYSWNGWETVPDGVARYGDAEVRHICNAAIEGPMTHDSAKLHAAHEAWNSLARLELILREPT